MTSMPIMLAMCSVFAFCDIANAASRAPVRSTPVARKSVATAVKTVEQPVVEEEKTEEVVEEKTPVEQESVIINKSSQFDVVVNEILDDSDDDNSFAAEIRRQRAAIAARESENAAKDSLNNAMRNGTNSCDADLRKCMMATCGNDFTKCALDGDTDFGDKLNKCKREINCSADEFPLFAQEIKDDRDMNVRLASHERTVNCGNQYNACIVNACGTTYNKCLGKKNADVAIEKCKTIAKECTESDSGLASRFGTAIGKLRESAEQDVVNDEKKLYDIRDSMRKACEKLGAMFDERTFDCVYTVNFFAGENQENPVASRKRYAGDTFVCMQEWFGINATTFKENAYRETRSQTGASSAMLGSGLGTAAGLITSGAIDRALETQKAKKELKNECKSQPGMVFKNGKCVEGGNTDKTETAVAQGEIGTPEKTLVNSKEKTAVDKDGNTTTKSKDTYSDGSTVNKVNIKDKDGNQTFDQTHTTKNDGKGNQSHNFETTSKGIKSTTKMTTSTNGNIQGKIDHTATFNTKAVKADTSGLKLNIPASSVGRSVGGSKK